MNFDYCKLRGRIREIFGTEKQFAKAMKMTAATLSAKLNGLQVFSQKEISLAVDLLQLSDSDIPTYFFSTKTSGT